MACMTLLLATFTKLGVKANLNPTKMERVTRNNTIPADLNDRETARALYILLVLQVRRVHYV